MPPLVEGLTEGVWAELDGHLVCPRCQTAAERREVAQRVVSAIENEIERRQQEGTPPDDFEAPLVDFAMTLRVHDAPGSTEDLPQREPELASSPAAAEDQRFEVAFTGAFLTGHPLAAHLDGYSDLQQELRKTLKAPQWLMEDPGPGGGTYRSGGGFTKAMPLIIARRDGSDLIPWLRTAAESAASTAESAASAAYPPVRFAVDVRATPSTLAVDVYDLGVAVMTACFNVVVSADAKPEERTRAVKKLAWLRPDAQGRSPVAEALQRIALRVRDEYGQAVAEVAPSKLPTPWLSLLPADQAPGLPDDRRSEEGGRLLWLHPVHVISTRDDDHKIHEAMVEKLSLPFSEKIKVEGGLFAPGIGSSAVVVSGSGDGAKTPVRLTKLHWAYYALYMEIDRGLLGVLNQQRWTEKAPIWRLEDDARVVFADYLRVMDARARLDTALSELGGDELAIWEVIAKVQRFETTVEAVERKLEVLNKVAQRRLELATAERTRRIGDILGFLTFLGLVTLIFAIVASLFGSYGGEGFSAMGARIAVVLGALIVAMGLYWIFFFRTSRAPRRTLLSRSES